MAKVKALEKKVDVLSQLLDLEVQKLQTIAGLDELEKQFAEWDQNIKDGKAGMRKNTVTECTAT